MQGIPLKNYGVPKRNGHGFLDAFMLHFYLSYFEEFWILQSRTRNNQGQGQGQGHATITPDRRKENAVRLAVMLPPLNNKLADWSSGQRAACYQAFTLAPISPSRQPPVLIIRRVHAVRCGMILLRRLRK